MTDGNLHADAEASTVLAQATSERGELVVRRRAGHFELRVNGVFVMDTAETGSERLLARELLDRHTRPRDILVGGLGLGFTVRELLGDRRVERVEVVEIEPAVLAWMRDGTLPGADLVADPRVVITVGDVRSVVMSLADRSLDGILLDIDNGPGNLVHDSNADVYGAAFLSCCRDRLRPGGGMTVWSAADAPELAETMSSVFGDCAVRALPVDLQGRDEHYWVYSSVRRRRLAGPAQ